VQCGWGSLVRNRCGSLVWEDFHVQRRCCASSKPSVSYLGGQTLNSNGTCEGLSLHGCVAFCVNVSEGVALWPLATSVKAQRTQIGGIKLMALTTIN
jgi:hypothetical protein